MSQSSTTPSCNSHSGISNAVLSAVADESIGRVTLAVLGDFAGCADEHGWCWPKLKNMAARRGMSLKAYSKHVRKLVAGGHLFRGMRHDHGGFWWLVANTQSEVALTLSTPSRLPGRLLYSTCSSTTPPLIAGEEEPQMQMLDLQELEGASAHSDGRTHPKEPERPKKKAPPKLNAYALAEKFGRKYRSHYLDSAPPSRAALGGAFAHWHREGISYEVIDIAIDMFFEATTNTLRAPADRVFLKQRFQWIEQAQDYFYETVTLPAAKEEHERRTLEWYEALRQLDPGAQFGMEFTPKDAIERLERLGRPVPAFPG